MLSLKYKRAKLFFKDCISKNRSLIKNNNSLIKDQGLKVQITITATLSRLTPPIDLKLTLFNRIKNSNLGHKSIAK